MYKNRKNSRKYPQNFHFVICSSHTGVGRSLVIGCSSAELAEKWEEMYPQLQPLESFYLPYFGVDDPERFQSAFPELWVVRK